MDEILAQLNSTLINITLVTDVTKKAVNDTFDSGAQEIEFFKYAMEVKRTLSFNVLLTLIRQCQMLMHI